VTALLERRHVYTRRREWRALLLAVIAVVTASGFWHAIRPAVTLALARRSVGCPGRELFLGWVLGAINPGMAENVTPAWSFRLRRGGVAYLSVSGQESLFFDERLQRIGSVSFFGRADPDPDGFDDDGSLKLVLPFMAYRTLGASAQSSAACGIIRLRQRRAEVVGVVMGPGSGAIWKDADNDGVPEIVFWQSARTRPIRLQIAASIKLDRNGVPLKDALPSDGSVLVWTPPDDRPVFIPDGVAATEFFQQLLPLPPTFGTFTPTTTSSAPASARSASP
jgi:hypothetical protein